MNPAPREQTNTHPSALGPQTAMPCCGAGRAPSTAHREEQAGGTSRRPEARSDPGSWLFNTLFTVLTPVLLTTTDDLLISKSQLLSLLIRTVPQAPDPDGKPPILPSTYIPESEIDTDLLPRLHRPIICGPSIHSPTRPSQNPRGSPQIPSLPPLPPLPNPARSTYPLESLSFSLPSH